jgi:hypothetical protein
VKVGDRVRVMVEGFTPSERAIFRFDGSYIGGDWIEEDSEGSRAFTVLAAVSGQHTISVSTGPRTVTKKITINPRIDLDRTSGPVGETVAVQLRGFGSGESIVVWFDTGGGLRSMVRVTATLQTGSANTSFIVPASTDSRHRVTATGTAGNTTYGAFRTRPSAYVSAGTPEPDRLVRVQFRGFVAGELVEARFDTQAGPSLGSTMASGTGSGSLAVRIPGNASEGSHYVWMIGNQGNNIRITLSVIAAGEPLPTRTPSATPTGATTATPVSGETATPELGSPTEAPPTGTIVAPTPGATTTSEISTETPTATATPSAPAASETPTGTPTPIATGESGTPPPTPSTGATEVNPEGT